MSDIPELTLDFLRKHPRDAAQVLLSLPSHTSGDFFGKISPELAARLIEHMPFDRAALMIAAMPPAAAAAIVEQMNAADAAVALRMISGPALNSLLAALPDSRKKMFSSQIQYPPHVVGAWMDAFPIQIGENLSVEDARRWLRQQNRNVEQGLYVVNPEGGVKGMVNLSRLALARNNLSIGKLMTREVPQVRDQANLESIRDLDDWEHFSALPVINHHRQLVGSLTRRTLDKALFLEGPNKGKVGVVPLVGDLFKGYLEGMINVVDWIAHKPDVETNKPHEKE